jgi:UDP-N-acetylglucosamine 2-epimerase (non-hydrolysing)
VAVRVLCVLGTRPEAIKLGPVVLAMRQRHADTGDIDVSVCATGQHRELLDEGLRPFGIVPDHDLDVMRPDQDPARVAAAVLERLPDVIAAERPDWVVVQGDTVSAAAASLAAFYCGVKVAHVEAGLRTDDKWRPYPEELSRRVVSVVADLHFAPTDRARDALLREHVPDTSIIVSGNPVVDAVHFVLEHHPTPPSPLPPVPAGTQRMLVTLHRRESFGAPLEGMCGAIRSLAEAAGQSLAVVLPVHPNPAVAETVRRVLGGIANVTLVEPMDYISTVHALRASDLVLTDSGGIQEESCALGVPALVLRDETERLEGVEAGCLELVGTDPKRIVERATARLAEATPSSGIPAQSPFGDGHASTRIVDALIAAG